MASGNYNCLESSNFEQKQRFVADYDDLELCNGLYVIPDIVDLFIWHICIFVHSGPYIGGVFRAVLTARDYPTARTCPVFTFIEKPLHPLVDPLVCMLAGSLPQQRNLFCALYPSVPSADW
jgi:ubiquitin-protein ligase